MSDISILERRDGEDRRALSPLGNGKGEWLRWLLGQAGAAVVAALLAYIAISDRLTALEAKQEAQFAEIQRFMNRIDATLTVLQQQERNRRD
jgi:glutathione S-transferase